MIMSLFTPLQDKESLGLPLPFENPSSMVSLTIIVVLIIMLVCLIYLANAYVVKLWVIVTAITTALVILVAGILGAYHYEDKFNELFETNRNTISDNIHEKYLVKDIIWNSEYTKVSLDPSLSLNDMSILVEDMNEHLVVLSYSIQDSGEVTLHDMPTFAGNPKGDIVLAKSLLK